MIQYLIKKLQNKFQITLIKIYNLLDNFAYQFNYKIQRINRNIMQTSASRRLMAS